MGVVPTNSGGTTYQVIIDDTTSIPIVTLDRAVTIDSLTNTETLQVSVGNSNIGVLTDNQGTIQITGPSAGITLSGTVTNTGNLSTTAGMLRLSNAVVANAGRSITGDGGIVEIANSTITGGVLRATDNADTFVQFAGDVTFNGVNWDDPGIGEFRVFSGEARLSGDYSHSLPFGYTLIVEPGAQLNISVGVFTNNGRIVLRGDVVCGFPCYWYSTPIPGTLFLLSNTTVAGSGEILLEPIGSDAARISGLAGVALTIAASQTLRGNGQVAVPLINNGVVEASGRYHFLVLLGPVENSGTIRAAFDGVFTISSSTVTNTNGTIVADGGIVEIANSTINGGTLVATHNAASFVQFVGDVTLNGVLWHDPGAGEFRILNGTARLLGDYADRLPAGHTLVVDAGAELRLGGGTFTNDGTLELRNRGYDKAAARLYLEADTTIEGSGRIVMSGPKSTISGNANVHLTVGRSQLIQGEGAVLRCQEQFDHTRSRRRNSRLLLLAVQRH